MKVDRLFSTYIDRRRDLSMKKGNTNGVIIFENGSDYATHQLSPERRSTLFSADIPRLLFYYTGAYLEI